LTEWIFGKTAIQRIVIWRIFIAPLKKQSLLNYSKTQNYETPWSKILLPVICLEKRLVNWTANESLAQQKRGLHNSNTWLKKLYIFFFIHSWRRFWHNIYKTYKLFCFCCLHIALKENNFSSFFSSSFILLNVWAVEPKKNIAIIIFIIVIIVRIFASLFGNVVTPDATKIKWNSNKLNKGWEWNFSFKDMLEENLFSCMEIWNEFDFCLLFGAWIFVVIWRDAALKSRPSWACDNLKLWN